MFVRNSLDYLLLQLCLLIVTVEVLFVNIRVHVHRSDLYKIAQTCMETSIKQFQKSRDDSQKKKSSKQG